MKKFVAVAAVISMVALAALAYGQMGGHEMGPDMGGPGMGHDMGGQGMGCGMMEKCGIGGSMMSSHPMGHLKGLNLDEKQKAAIEEIQSMVEKESVRRMADMHLAHIELRDLLRKDPVDMKAVEAKMKQAEALRTDMHLSHIKAMEDIKAKLTPEQRKKFNEMMEAGPMMGKRGMMHDCRTMKE